MNVKRRRRPNEKSLDFLHSTDETAILYGQLLATERKLDSLLVRYASHTHMYIIKLFRKRLDVQEALSRPMKVSIEHECKWIIEFAAEQGDSQSFHLQHCSGRGRRWTSLLDPTCRGKITC